MEGTETSAPLVSSEIPQPRPESPEPAKNLSEIPLPEVQTLAELPNTDNLLDVPKTTVLGIQQAKRRLHAFSLMKQTKMPDSPLKKQAVTVKPKIVVKTEEVYDENGAKLEEKVVVKKPPKKSTDKKSKTVIEQIEEMKKEENAYLKNLELGFLDSKERFKKPEHKDDNRRSDDRKHRKYSRRRSKSPTPDVAYPSNWSELKTRQLDVETLRNLRVKLTGDLKTGPSDFRKQLAFGHGRCLLSSLKVRAVNGGERVVPAQFVRFSKASPVVSYSVNHTKFKQKFPGRKEVFHYVPKSFEENCKKIINCTHTRYKTDPRPKPKLRKWFSKNVLPVLNDQTDCEILEPSLGLSSLKNYTDHEDEESESTENLVATVVNEDEEKESAKDAAENKVTDETVVEQEPEKVKKGKKVKEKAKKKREKEKKSKSKSGTRTNKKRKRLHSSSSDDLGKTKGEKLKKCGEKASGKEKSEPKYANIEPKKSKRSESREKEKKTELADEIKPKPSLNEPATQNAPATQIEDSKKPKEKPKKQPKPPSSKEKSKKRRERRQSRDESKKPADKRAPDGHTPETTGKKSGETTSNTPDTDEYHSLWESDEDVPDDRDLKSRQERKRLNRSWESDEEVFERPKSSPGPIEGHRRGSLDRKKSSVPSPDRLEMPLNIRPFNRSEARWEEAVDARYKQYHGGPVRESDIFSLAPLYGWEKDEVRLLEEERKTLDEQRRLLEIEKQKLEELERRRFYQDLERLDDERGYERRRSDDAFDEFRLSEKDVTHVKKDDFKIARKSRWDTPDEDDDDDDRHYLKKPIGDKRQKKKKEKKEKKEKSPKKKKDRKSDVGNDSDMKTPPKTPPNDEEKVAVPETQKLENEYEEFIKAVGAESEEKKRRRRSSSSSYSSSSSSSWESGSSSGSTMTSSSGSESSTDSDDKRRKRKMRTSKAKDGVKKAKREAENSQTQLEATLPLATTPSKPEHVSSSSLPDLNLLEPSPLIEALLPRPVPSPDISNLPVPDLPSLTQPPLLNLETSTTVVVVSDSLLENVVDANADSTTLASDTVKTPFVFNAISLPSRKALIVNSSLNLDDESSSPKGALSKISEESGTPVLDEKTNADEVHHQKPQQQQVEKKNEVKKEAKSLKEKRSSERKKSSPRRRGSSPKRWRSRSVSPRRRRELTPRRRSPRRRANLSPIRRVSPRRRLARRNLSPHSRPRNISPRRARHALSPLRRDGSPKRHRELSPLLRRKRDHSPRNVFDIPRKASPDHGKITTSSVQQKGATASSSSGNKSPLHSPLDGFKRSLADSTISDDLLLQRNAMCFGESPVYGRTVAGSPLSPKRVPLDVRINQVLGLESDELKPPDMKVPPHPQNFIAPPHFYEQVQYADMYMNKSNFIPYPDASILCHPPPQITTKVVQVGNMLQIVPTDEVPPPPPPEVECTQKIVQVGNILQIVPSEMGSSANVPSQEMVQNGSEKLSVDQLLTRKLQERRDAKERRRLERERKRKEKEAKKGDKDQKKQMKLQLKTEKMIKKALLIEISETTNAEDQENVDTTDWTNVPIIVSDDTDKPAGKGILISRGFSKLNEDRRKSVKFADGVCPGEGTSPSGGEELSSPPPVKLPKEKRYKKTKTIKKAKKKKVKVKVIRTQPAPDNPADDDEDDNLPPPPPPPGSPPPHLFPPRVKTHTLNNLHPSLASGLAGVPQQRNGQPLFQQPLYRLSMPVVGAMPPPPPHGVHLGHHHHHGRPF